MPETNPYQQQRRYTKALKLASHLSAAGIKAAELPMIEPAQWDALAERVGVNPPKFVDGKSETVAVVDQILREFEAAEARRDVEQGAVAFDPFAKFLEPIMTHGSVAAAVRHSKETHPERFCPDLRCLWRVPHASDCAHWAGEPCDCLTAKETR